MRHPVVRYARAGTETAYGGRQLPHFTIMRQSIQMQPHLLPQYSDFTGTDLASRGTGVPTYALAMRCPVLACALWYSGIRLRARYAMCGTTRSLCSVRGGGSATMCDTEIAYVRPASAAARADQPPGQRCYLPAPRNPIQETAFSVQFVQVMRFLVIDSGVYALAMRAVVLVVGA
eukprot:1582806-Rhodomonas_salina.1